MGSYDAKRENKLGFVVKKLDSVLQKKHLRKVDELYIKIDIEGSEIEALKGAMELLTIPKGVTLLIEDWQGKKIINYLTKNNFIFVKKLTPYNSFWKREQMKRL